MTHPNRPESTPQPPPAKTVQDIDLFEILADLWQRKWIVLAITATSLALATLYLMLTSPVYESTARLRPPLASHLVSINETGQLQLPPDEAFSRVVFEARSRETQREVFLVFKDRLLGEPNVGQELLDQLFLRAFMPSLQIGIYGLDDEDILAETTMSIQFRHADPQLAADIANAIAATAQRRALGAVMDDLSTLLNTRIHMLESRIARGATILKRSDQDTVVQLAEEDALKRLQLQDRIAALTKKARTLRADKITELNEALAIARSLDIEEPVTLQILANRTNGRELVAVSADMSMGEEDPLYLRGSRILEAELIALKNRDTDAHMVPALRDLEEQLDLLAQNRRIEILQARENYAALAENTDILRGEISQLQELQAAAYNEVLLARVDQTAIARSQPISPKKERTLALAFAAGLMLGVLIALVMAAVQNRRQPPPAADTAQ